MDITNRNRRLREFNLWFAYKYGLRPFSTNILGVQKIIEQTLHIQALIKTHKPVCYWCRKAILTTDITVDTDEVTLHHIDENRDHNTVDNLDICHKTCHQHMHKTSQMNTIPTAVLWSLAHGKFESFNANVSTEIPGIGRG